MCSKGGGAHSYGAHACACVCILRPFEALQEQEVLRSYLSLCSKQCLPLREPLFLLLIDANFQIKLLVVGGVPTEDTDCFCAF